MQRAQASIQLSYAVQLFLLYLILSISSNMGLSEAFTPPGGFYDINQRRRHRDVNYRSGIDKKVADKRRRPTFKSEFAGCLLRSEDITVTFDDVHLKQSVFETISSLAMPILNPNASTFGVLSRARTPGVLLYGPPGTGKSLLVKALAKQICASIITVTDADVRSKYPGVGEKNIQRVFENARRHHPCIIFIDKADSIFASRIANNGLTGGHACSLNQFLAEMDGIMFDPVKSPMVIAATDRPFAMDEGILCRLGTRILVDLPDAAGRERILRIHLRDEPLSDDVDIDELVRVTPDYTGSDLNNFVIAAARYAEKDNIEQMGVSLDLGGQTKPESSQTQSPVSVPADRLIRRTTCRAHFIRAKNETRPAPKSETVSLIRQFDNMHGSISKSGRNVHFFNKEKPIVTM